MFVFPIQTCVALHNDTYFALNALLILSNLFTDDIRKKSYQCTFNQDAQFAVYFQGKETNGIPLRCK